MIISLYFFADAAAVSSLRLGETEANVTRTFAPKSSFESWLGAINLDCTTMCTVEPMGKNAETSLSTECPMVDQPMTNKCSGSRIALRAVASALVAISPRKPVKTTLSSSSAMAITLSPF